MSRQAAARLLPILLLLAAACGPASSDPTDELPPADEGGYSGPDAGTANQADPEDPPREDEPRTLRIMTYNIKHAELADTRQLAETIRENDPDIVALQEVDKFAPRSGDEFQAYRLAQRTGMAPSFRRSLVLADGGEYGLALLSRYPIVSSDKLLLTSGSEQRVVVVWQIDLGGGVIVNVANTHFGLDAAERGTEASELLDYVKDRDHLLVLGDLNETPEGGDVHSTLSAELRDAWEAAGQDPSGGQTFPSDGPDRRIDYIFLGSDWAAPTYAKPVTAATSDHLPLLAEIPLPAPH